MHTVYVLYSKSIDRLYIGQTKNLDKRIQEHIIGNSFYTRRAKDWKIIYTENHSTRSEALKREKQLKSYQGRKFLRNKIKSGC